MKHKNLYVSLVVVVALVAGGGWYLQHVVTEKVGNQVLAALSNTCVQNEISGLANSTLLGNTTGLGTANHGAQASSHGQASGSGNDAASSTSSQGAGTGGNNGSTGSGQGSGQGVSQGTGSGASTSSSSGQVASNGQGGQGAVQTSQANGSASGVPNFTSRQQLIQFAMSRFTTAQIAHYIQLYAERASLSEQQKAQIKQQILSHFTPAEIQAMAAAAKRFP